MYGSFFTFDVTPLDDAPRKEVKGFCARCRNSGLSHVSWFPEKVWDRLPSYFGLPDWNTLKAQDVMLA